MKIQIVFDGPPEAVAGRFVEVEQDGKGVSIGAWMQRPDGYWTLEFDDPRRIAGLERQIELYQAIRIKVGGQFKSLKAVEDAARDAALEEAVRLMEACEDPEGAAAIRVLKK